MSLEENRFDKRGRLYRGEVVRGFKKRVRNILRRGRWDLCLMETWSEWMGLGYLLRILRLQVQMVLLTSDWKRCGNGRNLQVATSTGPAGCQKYLNNLNDLEEFFSSLLIWPRPHPNVSYPTMHLNRREIHKLDVIGLNLVMLSKKLASVRLMLLAKFGLS